MNRFLFLILFLLFSSFSFAQLIGFEKEIPETFTVGKESKLTQSSRYYKEGKRSLEWSFQPKGILDVAITPIHLNKKKEALYGITLWIYNEKTQQDSVRIEFLTQSGEVSYWFSYQLKAVGWRACWISFNHMKGTKQNKAIVGYRMVAPQRAGRIFLDRLTFPMKKMNLRTTPDEQISYNNSLSFRDLWHWCRVWQWEQYTYKLPLAEKLSDKQEKQLQLIEKRLDKAVGLKSAPKAQVEAAYRLFRLANIRPSGSGFTGSPLLSPDELDRKKGEISWSDLEIMLSGFAYDAVYNHSKKAEQNYFTIFDYAINQGFAFGSGMGTNHHYGYQVRKIYTTAWMMRKSIYTRHNRDAILSALYFWAALQETRKPYQYGRDELLDSWHTLLMPKTISAMLIPDKYERERALRSLSVWISTSLNYTPGTIGGIKVDGTTFHHGGFYPAYTTGVLAVVGQFIAFTSGTEYEISITGRKVLKKAFSAMRNYCNLFDWGIGISGRHPFGGSMKADDIEAFASLALAGDLSNKNQSFDHGLAADYLRLSEKKKSSKAQYFMKQGIKPAPAPEGFFVYNYGSTGIFRRANWMVTLKGYNTDVWGAEIYAKDNRYGRYQSYGSVQIIGKGKPISRIGSGFVEQGWDWNRVPGTTTIHLPFELLESPLPGTTMAKSKETFSGSSSLNKKNGVFAMKLMERELKNFTSDFVARKSVFCFDNRMICLGTGITNSNTTYPTETTLFQCEYRGGEKSLATNYWLNDGYDNYYHVVEGAIRTQVTKQQSLHEKKRTATQGTFTSAWIEHGKAPKEASYEYLVLIQPNTSELKKTKQKKGYCVLNRDNTAHVVYDEQTGITAYAAFEAYQPKVDKIFHSISAETLIMHQIKGNEIYLSICDPNLNLKEKEYTTKQPSRPIEKKVVLKGAWKLSAPNIQIHSIRCGEVTELIVNCLHGQPVECLLQKLD